MAALIDLIKQVVEVALERAKTRKALRILNRQEWSIEFLESMLKRAADSKKQQLQMVIVGPKGEQLIVTTVDKEVHKQPVKTESIFDKLDDDVAIRQFMEQIR